MCMFGSVQGSVSAVDCVVQLDDTVSTACDVTVSAPAQNMAGEVVVSLIPFGDATNAGSFTFTYVEPCDFEDFCVNALKMVVDHKKIVAQPPSGSTCVVMYCEEAPVPPRVTYLYPQKGVSGCSVTIKVTVVGFSLISSANEVAATFTTAAGGTMPGSIALDGNPTIKEASFAITAPSGLPPGINVVAVVKGAFSASFSYVALGVYEGTPTTVSVTPSSAMYTRASSISLKLSNVPPLTDDSMFQAILGTKMGIVSGYAQDGPDATFQITTPIVEATGAVTGTFTISIVDCNGLTNVYTASFDFTFVQYATPVVVSFFPVKIWSMEANLLSIKVKV